MKVRKFLSAMLIIFVLASVVVVPSFAEEAEITVTETVAPAINDITTTTIPNVTRNEVSSSGNTTYYRMNAALDTQTTPFTLSFDLDMGDKPTKENGTYYVLTAFEGAGGTYMWGALRNDGNVQDGHFLSPYVGWNDTHSYKFTYLGEKKSENGDMYISISNLAAANGNDWGDYFKFNSTGTTSRIDVITDQRYVGLEGSGKPIILKNLKVSYANLRFENMASSYAVGSDVSFDVIAPDNMTEGLLLIDGKLVKKLSHGENENAWTVNIPASNVTSGSHEVIFKAKYADGSEEVISNNFNVTSEKSIAVVTDATTYPLTTMDFDAYLANVSGTQSNDKNVTAIFGGYWSVTGSNAIRVSGPSGESTDYGVQLSSRSTTTYLLMNPRAAEGKTLVDTGKLVFESDINCSDDAVMELDEMRSWMGTGDIISAGKLQGANTDVSFVNTWKKLKMVLNWESQRWTVYVDGELVINNAPAKSTGDECRRIRFNYTAGTVAFDNIRVYNEVPGDAIVSAKYDSTSITDNIIPYTASNLTLTMSSEVSAPVVKVNDVVTDADVSGTDITVPLIGLKANTELKVEVDGASKVFKVSDGSKYIKSIGFMDNGNALYTGVLTHGAGTYTIIGAAYDDDGLVAVNPVTVEAIDGFDINTMPFAKNTGKYIKFMIWDSLTGNLTPISTADVLNLQ